MRAERSRAAGSRARRALKATTGVKLAPALSQEMIVAAARTLARRHGLARVSMRLLGDHLGVSAPAIYHHFKSKGALLEGVAASIFEEVAEIEPDAHWTAQLRAFVLAYQEQLIEYPGLARVILANRESRAGLLWTETVLSILTRAGFGEDTIWPAYGMLVFFVNPMTLFDERPHKGRQTLQDPKLIRRAIAKSPHAYPTIAASLASRREPVAYSALLPQVLDRIIAQIEHDAVQA